VTSSERRLASQLGVSPLEVLRSTIPLAALPGKATRRRIEQLRKALSKRLQTLAEGAREEVPGLAGDVDATARKLDAAVTWLDGRLAGAAARDAEVTVGRWRRLRAFLRPYGESQERRLSVLGPLLKLGAEFPARLVEALDPTDPGMHLLFWGEGGLW
jgi:hypothetical protein